MDCPSGLVPLQPTSSWLDEVCCHSLVNLDVPSFGCSGGSRWRGMASLHMEMFYGFHYLEQQSSVIALGQ